MSVSFSIVGVCVAALGPPLPGDVANLVAAARQGAPRTSHVDWAVEHREKYNGGLVERMTTETVSDSILENNYGDERGNHELKFHGKPPFAENLSREEAMRYALPPEIDAGTRRSLLLKDEVLVNPVVELPVAGLSDPQSPHHPGASDACGLQA